VPKVVFDSTTLVSAFLRKGGVTGKLLERAAQGEFELYLADAIIEETRQVLLNREHLRLHFSYTNLEVEEYASLLRTFARLVSHLPSVKICRDPNDDYVIATALAAGASYLVARDKDLLTLATYQDVTMISPEAFMQFLRG
jgi:putative PIN family toxin of toxin-antitoxin system